MFLNGHEDLLAEGGCATIPEEAFFPGKVEERHGVSRARVSVDSDAETAGVRKSFFGIVTGEAGDGVILGKRRVLEEFLAKGNPLLDQGVVHG